MFCFTKLIGKLSRRAVLVALLLMGPLVSAQITVTPEFPIMLQNGWQHFTATRVAPGPANWTWSVEEPHGGTINPATGHYHAPAVEVSTLVNIRVVDLAHPEEQAHARVLVCPALINILFALPVVEAGQHFKLEAVRADGEPPAWAWEVDPGGLMVKEHGVFSAPQVAAPTTLFVRLRDTAHEGPPAEVAVRVVPAMVTLTAPAEPVLAGASYELVGARADGQSHDWSWRRAPGEGFIAGLPNGRVTFVAPRVASPTTLKIQANSAGNSAWVAVQVLPRIALKPVEQSLIAGNACELKATRRDQLVPAWSWSLAGHGEGTFRMLGDGRVFFRAPEVLIPTTIALQVIDLAHPEDRAWVPIHLLPRYPELSLGDGDLVFQTLMPGLLGPDWMVPSATLFGGTVKQSIGFDEWPKAPWARAIGGLCHVADDPAMEALNETWLVGDARGIHGVDEKGEHRHLACGPVTVLASRPRNSAPDNPLHVVFSTLHPDEDDEDDEEDEHPLGVLRSLNPDGTTRILAGKEARARGEVTGQDGAGEEVLLEEILSLAIAPDGTVFLAEGPRIRRVSPAGMVTTLATFDPDQRLRLARNADTGLLYASVGHALVQITPDGAVSPLLGRERQLGFEPVAAGQPVPLGAACLNRPQLLQSHGQYLFIFDEMNNALRVFNLETRVLQTLIGTSSFEGMRMGALRLFSPDLPPDAWASLGMEPVAMAIHADGTCVVASEQGLVQLELAGLAEPGAEGLPEPSCASASSSSSAPSPVIK